MDRQPATVTILNADATRLDLAKEMLDRATKAFMGASNPDKADIENLKRAVSECERAWSSTSYINGAAVGGNPVTITQLGG